MLLLIAVLAGSAAVGDYPRDPQLVPAWSYPRDGSVRAASAIGEVRPAAPDELAPQPEPSVPKSVPAPSEQGDALVLAAVRMLNGQVSIEAKVRQEAHLFDRVLVGSGNYQQGRDVARQWRLELSMRDGADQSLYQQLCDGQTLWVYQRTGDLQELRKVDLARANQTLGASTGEGGSPPIDWGTGGLPQLLGNIAEVFRFAPPVAERTGVKAWTVRGEWRPEYLAALLPDQKGKILKGEAADLHRLKPHLPHEVLVTLRAADLFPMRIEFRRTPKLRFYEKLYRTAEPESLSVLEFFDIRLGMPIDPNRFAWRSGNMDLIDHTPEQISDVQVLNRTVIENRANND